MLLVVVQSWDPMVLLIENCMGNLHFNMTEFQLKQIFEAFGPVELVQLPTDPETGNCKGFGFIQVSITSY
ncbi:hypothetical protein ACSBR1_027840 [Camellia fascicularis]